MTDSTPMVGEAKDGDVDAISAFLWEAWRQAGPGAPGFAGATEEVIADVADPDLIRSRIGGPDHRMYIARSGDRVIGFASARAETGETVELSGIVVLRERGRGRDRHPVARRCGGGIKELRVHHDDRQHRDRQRASDPLLPAPRLRRHGHRSRAGRGDPVDVVTLARRL
jgi:hypothetical protein